MSKIVNLNGRPVTSEANNVPVQNANPNPVLSRSEFEQMAGALARLHELAAYEVKTAAHDAEIRGLHEYLANTFLLHGPEFLGAWHTVQQEYQPLLRTVAVVARRVGGILAQAASLEEGSK